MAGKGKHGLAYFCSISVRPAGRKVDATPVIESGMSGAGVLAGLHLAYGSVCPALMTHLVDGAGSTVKLADLFLKLGSKFQSADLYFEIETLHAIHIFIAGVATTVIAGIALVKFCKGT